MSRHEYETIDLTPTNKHEDTDPRPVHIKYGDVAMDLPRLDDSSQLPTSMLIAGMTAASQGWNNLDDDQKLAFMATMLAWLAREYPRFERELDRKSGDKTLDIGRIFAAWAKATKDMDPKASSSSTSA
ncbi:hypothetical protein LF919_05235 [Bifidobacterium pseudolongum]|uniref:hypothetical protein n=1 Tax=Bifidobacterium pseudolongum TaxID=1694 RepID=UPI001F11283A|nr:hypothetical protein [Bifidobacterium pseudolongum]MCH4835302.1 hypothetical protein [Bifidobacterium pseudolongum]